MSRHNNTNYITLQEYLPISEQKRLAKAILRVLPIVAPSQRFVQQLKHDLLVEAAQQMQTRTVTQQVLRTAGVIGGSALSILGVVWWISHRNNHPSDAAHLAA